MIYALKVSRLTKMYSEKDGIKNAYLRIRPNESIGIIGPNGSGKTTLVELLLRIRKRDKGEILYFNKNIDDNYSEILKIIGALDLNKEELAEQKLSAIIKLHSLNYKENFDREIEYYRAKLFLDLDKKLKMLSSGEVQKFKILLALYHRPKIVILDEPTIFLDGEMTITLKNIINDLRYKGVNFIIASHDIPFLKDVTDGLYKVKNNEIAKIEVPDIDKELKKIIFKNDGQDVEIKGAIKKQVTNDYIKIIYKGDVNNLLKQLLKYKIKDITITEPTYNDFPEYNNQNV